MQHHPQTERDALEAPTHDPTGPQLLESVQREIDALGELARLSAEMEALCDTWLPTKIAEYEAAETDEERAAVLAWIELLATGSAKASVDREGAMERGREALRDRRALRRPDPSLIAPARSGPRRRGAGRPRAAATRSSVRSGDSGPDDSDPEPEPAATPAAREAVAVVFEEVMRQRHPGVSWSVEGVER